MKDFNNKVAAVTGAASGIGRELACVLAARNCHLALSDVNMTGLAETAGMARKAGPNVKITTASVDTADRDAVYAWADRTAAEHGRVNMIFNNAGVALSTLLEQVKPEDFQWIMGINFWGVVWGTQAFIPHLRASGDGHVINISSIFGIMSVPYNGCYNTSKFAVRGFTEALRMELELVQAPVSATCVHPGGIRTNIARDARIDRRSQVLTGKDPLVSIKKFDEMLNTTSARSAALQIVRAVEKNRRRVLVGSDAKFLDKMVRLLGSWYQPLVVRAVRRAS